LAFDQHDDPSAIGHHPVAWLRLPIRGANQIIRADAACFAVNLSSAGATYMTAY